MSDQNLSTISAKVSKAEKTPELSQYWQKRYEKILSSELFVESEKTAELILSEEIVENPATPFGDINLLNHLDANGKLDDIKLQSTVETAVRFLDSCLDVIGFDEESKFIVTQYRKIGVGLADVSEFLEKMGDASELKTIDHLGNLISNSAYRASETLAEEKSPCGNWNQINRHLRPRSFEVWIDPKTDQRYTGLNLSEEYDEETVLETELQIVPRRNSNILLFPPDLEWQIWSDRDNLAPETKITEYQAPAPEIKLDEVLSEKIPENTQESEVEEESFDKIIANNSQSLDKIQDSEPESETTENTQELPTLAPQILAPKTDELLEENNLETLPKNSFGFIEDDQIEEEVLTPQEPEQSKKIEDIDSQDAFKFGVQDSQKVPETPKQELKIEHDHEELLHSESTSQIQDLEALQIGELVKIVKQNDPEFGKIYQIVDFIEGQDNPTRYHLAGGNPEIEKVLWSENDLEPIDLDDLLINLNSQTDLPKPSDLEAMKAEFERQKNLEVALYKEQIKEEMIQKYTNKTETASKPQDDTKIKQLEKELQIAKGELISLKQSSPSNSETDKIELTVDELEAKISERVKEYLASADYKNQINRLVQEKTASLKNKTNSPSASSISTLKMLKKYQNLK
jgi:hypothetical protein